MRFVGRVLNAEGEPHAGTADLVVSREGKLVAVAKGSIKTGLLKLTAEVGPAWGLRVDGRAVLAVVGAVDEETADLGTISLLAKPVAFTVFHAADGLIHGAPSPPRQSSAEGETVARTVTFSTGKTTLGISELLDSASSQIAGAALKSADSLALTGATLTVKGIATNADDGFAFHLPTLQELGTTIGGLSELSISLKPPVAGEGTGAPAEEARASVPDLIGYTRELAQRKVVAAGFIPELGAEAVSGAAQAGRVVRQVPAAGTSHPLRATVRVFLGKLKGA